MASDLLLLKQGEEGCEGGGTQAAPGSAGAGDGAVQGVRTARGRLPGHVYLLG